MRRLALLSAAAAVTAAFVPAGQGAETILIGKVGPGFTITLTNGGVGVTQLDPGGYTIQVTDDSDLHNFHLSGPGGVSQFTGIEETGTFTWTVTLVDGVYTFVCDAHVASMKRTFRVGAAPPTTAPSKLFGVVGPGRKLTLGKVSGRRTTTVAGGKYSIAVRDRSKTESFHLSGPGVNRKTGTKFVGSATWAVTLKAASTYRYWSDAHPSVKVTIKTS